MLQEIQVKTPNHVLRKRPEQNVLPNHSQFIKRPQPRVIPEGRFPKQPPPRLFRALALVRTQRSQPRRYVWAHARIPPHSTLPLHIRVLHADYEGNHDQSQNCSSGPYNLEFLARLFLPSPVGLLPPLNPRLDHVNPGGEGLYLVTAPVYAFLERRDSPLLLFKLASST